MLAVLITTITLGGATAIVDDVDTVRGEPVRQDAAFAVSHGTLKRGVGIGPRAVMLHRTCDDLMMVAQEATMASVGPLQR